MFANNVEDKQAESQKRAECQSYDEIKNKFIRDKNELQGAVDEIVEMAESQDNLDKGMIILLIENMELTFDQKYYLTQYIIEYDDPVVGKVKDEYLSYFDGFLTEGQRFSLSMIGENLPKNFKKFIDKEYYQSYSQDVF